MQLADSSDDLNSSREYGSTAPWCGWVIPGDHLRSVGLVVGVAVRARGTWCAN